MNDIWTNRLSEYIDGELNATERAALDAHLASCGRCYATLADLRDVVARAKSLGDREPAKDLWAGIRAGMTPDAPVRLGDRRDRLVRRPLCLRVGQVLGARIPLNLGSGGGGGRALPRPPPPLL